MREARRIAALVLAGGAVGVGLNRLSPHPADLRAPVYAAAESGVATCSSGHAANEASGIASISTPEAESLCTACSAGFVDARAASDYAEGHVPGALHLPPHGHGGEPAVVAQLRRHPTVVVYDSGAGCHLAESVAQHLRAEGLRDVRVLDGAWPAWEATGGPAQSGACMACEGLAHRAGTPTEATR